MKEINKIKPILNHFKKSTRPILSQVKINTTSLTVTDLETTIKFHDNYGLSKGLHSIETLGLIDTPQDSSDYPVIPMDIPNTTDTFTLLLSALESLIPFASKDETRLHLKGIAVDYSNFVATDGFTLKHLPIIGRTENSYIMPVNSMKILVKLFKKFKLKGEISFQVDDIDLIVNTEYFTLKAKLIQREYPKWQSIIPTKFDKKIVIDNWIDFKELKPLFNQRSFACTLENIEGNIVLKIPNIDNQYIIGKAEINFKLGYNVKLIERAIGKSKAFNIQFNNEVAPTLINEAIIMPLKV